MRTIQVFDVLFLLQCCGQLQSFHGVSFCCGKCGEPKRERMAVVKRTDRIHVIDEVGDDEDGDFRKTE